MSNTLESFQYIHEYLSDYGEMPWKMAVYRMSDEFGMTNPDTDRAIAFMVSEGLLKETSLNHPIEGFKSMRAIQAVSGGEYQISPEMLSRYNSFVVIYTERMNAMKQKSSERNLEIRKARKELKISRVQKAIANTQFSIRKLDLDIAVTRDRIEAGLARADTARALDKKVERRFSAGERLAKLQATLATLNAPPIAQV